MFRGVDPRDGATPWLLKRCRAREFDEFHAEVRGGDEERRGGGGECPVCGADAGEGGKYTFEELLPPLVLPSPSHPTRPPPFLLRPPPFLLRPPPLACLPRPLPPGVPPPPPPSPWRASSLPPPAPWRAFPAPLPLACAPSRGKQVTEMGNKNHPQPGAAAGVLRRARQAGPVGEGRGV
ncbi:unnamed protein product [Closterium sp. NIES-65]|nr:unnamed protein product [Closterium sp. NIES-65]